LDTSLFVDNACVGLLKVGFKSSSPKSTRRRSNTSCERRMRRPGRLPHCAVPTFGRDRSLPVIFSQLCSFSQSYALNLPL